MDADDPDPSPEGTPLETALQQKLDLVESASYAQNISSVVSDFATRTGVTTLEEIDYTTCREYARQLNRAIDDPEQALSSPRSAKTNYATLRAFLSECVKDRLIESNPAMDPDAKAALPSIQDDPHRQFWSPEDREYFCSYVDRLNDLAQDRKIDVDPYLAQRNQVLVYLLALTGVRGAEIFRDPRSDRRHGLRWKDVKDTSFQVLGKSGNMESIGYSGPEKARLSRWKARLSPGPEWPVSPVTTPRTLHRSDYGVGDELADTPYEPQSEQHPLEACAEYGIIPPAVSLQQVRNIVRDLSQEIGLPTNSDDGYLKLHGARRGLGSQLYQIDPVEAQDTLRHQSIETTHASYREERAAESGRRRAEMLDLEWDDSSSL